MSEGNPRSSRNVQTAIARTAFADHGLQEVAGVRSACGKGARLDVALLFY